jgi:hypothetical protein
MADLAIQILGELRKCVDRRLSMDEFRAWFVPLSLEIERSGQPPAIELAHRLDGILAEASSANWSEDDLRQELADIGLSSGTGPYAESIHTEKPQPQL